MQDYHAGQHVVCVDDANQRQNGLKNGTVYTVLNVRTGPNVLIYNETGEIAHISKEIIVLVRLVEVEVAYTRAGVKICSEAYNYGFRSSRFRPLKKLKVEDFCSIKIKEDA